MRTAARNIFPFKIFKINIFHNIISKATATVLALRAMAGAILWLK